MPATPAGLILNAPEMEQNYGRSGQALQGWLRQLKLLFDSNTCG
jgi:hypothetical protein